MIDKAKKLVKELMQNEDSGHGMDHVERVFDLAMKFAENENCNKQIVALSALLHDVDDYKLFGNENQKQLTNTNRILTELKVDDQTKKSVLDIVSKIGYSKSLKGIRPTTIEGMIVSDADMCDALGANGLLRSHKYSIKFGKDFFDKNAWPIDNISAGVYTTKTSDSSVCHVFEKTLKLKNLMMTNSGKQEATIRHNFVVSFLRQLFNEENANDWNQYLDKYLSNLD